MGLDISYYRNLTPVECTVARSKGCDHVHTYVEDAFEGREAPLVKGRCYDGEFVGDFRAGSYSGYSVWRNELAKLAGYPKAAPTDAYANSYPYASSAWADQDSNRANEAEDTTRPFYELINFSDCEGTIGSEAAARLAKDFAEFDDHAKGAMSEPWMYERYQLWRKAFEAASENGAVRFH